jgi:hypothetical protein
MATAAQDQTSQGSYPTSQLKEALTLAQKVFELGGTSTPIPKSQLAAQLDVSDKSSAFIGRIGAARLFGLIDGRGAYTVTPESLAYFAPTESGGEKKALAGFMANPPLFKKIVTRFDGQKLPDIKTLGNIFFTEKLVGQTWAARVAGLFINSADEAGVIDSSGYLRYGAIMKGAATPTAKPPPWEAKKTERPEEDEEEGQDESGVDIWKSVDAKTGSKIKLEIRGELSPDGWLRLKNYVTIVLKPPGVLEPKE